MLPNVKVILVSPLKRALETAYLIFKDHLNFKNIKVIVDPNLREILKNSWDIPNSIHDTVAHFKKLFPCFDYSLLQ